MTAKLTTRVMRERQFLIKEGYAVEGDSKRQLCRAGHHLCNDLQVVRRLNGSKLGLRKRFQMPSFPNSKVGRFANQV